MKNPQCVEIVSKQDGLATYRYQCERQGWDEENGKWYCKQHHPRTVAERREASRKKYDAHWDELQAQATLRQKKDEVWAILSEINPDDPLGALKKLIEAQP